MNRIGMGATVPARLDEVLTTSITHEPTLKSCDGTAFEKRKVGTAIMSDLSKKFEDLNLEVRSLEEEYKRLSELLSGYLNERDRLDICTTRIQGTTEACKYSPESSFDTAIRLLETLSKRVAELESSQIPSVKEAWQNFLDVWAIHRSGPSEETASAMLEAIRRYGNARAFERTGRISELEAVCRQVLDWLPSTDEDLRMQAPRTALANALER